MAAPASQKNRNQIFTRPTISQVAAIIPALNEAESIGGVVESLLRQTTASLQQVIVVDNGSIDGTGDIARQAGATVVREERRGYGYACHTGVEAADEADVIVLLDGDAADNPDDLPAILDPILAGAADLAVGSRVLGAADRGSMTGQQVLGNRLAIWLIRRIYGLESTDLGPFRAIRRSSLRRLDMREMTYGWSVEMVVKAARADYLYQEVPVHYRRRVGTSKVGGTVRGSLRAGWSILWTTFRYARWNPQHPPVRDTKEPRR